MYSSVGLSLYTDLCNRQHYLIPEQSHHLRENPCTHSLPAPILSPPAPSNHSFFALWICLVWTFRVSVTMSSVACCVWVLSLSMMFSRFIHVVACVNTSPLFKADCMDIPPLFIQLAVCGLLGYFHFLPIVNNATVNLHMQVFM